MLVIRCDIASVVEKCSSDRRQYENFRGSCTTSVAAALVDVPCYNKPMRLQQLHVNPPSMLCTYDSSLWTHVDKLVCYKRGDTAVPYTASIACTQYSTLSAQQILSPSAFAISLTTSPFTN